MRRSVLTALVLALVPAPVLAPVLVPAPVLAAGSTAPAAYDFLAAQVFEVPGRGAVAVGMPSPRVVKVQQRRADGTWTRPRELFRKPGVTCGQVDGRASAGGVALLLECDRPYYEDQAPVHSVALVTRDLSTWAGRRLRGEAYQDPAISADGSHAAWLQGGHGQFLRYDAGVGFTTGTTSFDYDSGGETVVVDNAGTVTVMGPDGNGDGCELGVWDTTLAGTEDHYVIPGVDPGCTEGGVDNVDDRTVVGGFSREQRFTVTRTPGQRWALRHGPPRDESSLVRYRGPGVVRNVYSDAAGQRLVSLGSPDRTRLFAQAYDDASGTWEPPTPVHTQARGTCRARQSYAFEPLPRLHAVRLRCTGGALLLTSHDSATWHVTRIGARPYGLSEDGSLLAAAGRRSTTVVSPSGTTVLPVSAPGRCDLVFPISADGVVRLHGGPQSRWPTRLQKSVGGSAWRTIQRVRMPERSACRSIRGDSYERPTAFFLRGDQQTYVSLVVRPGGRGGWHVERFRY